MQGTETASAISLKYLSLPKNLNGSVNTEIQSAPAFSYSLAISRWGKSAAISPFDGDAFLHSHIKAISSFLSAFSNSNPPFSIPSAFAFISSNGTFLFASSTRPLASCANSSSIFILNTSSVRNFNQFFKRCRCLAAVDKLCRQLYTVRHCFRFAADIQRRAGIHKRGVALVTFCAA